MISVSCYRSGEAHGFIIRGHQRMECSGEQLGLSSERSDQADVVESDFGVVVDVVQDEISVKFSCFKGEFVFTDQSITLLGLEVQDLIISARKLNEIRASPTFDGVVTLATFYGVIT